ncbi:uncharacterized protein LOC130803819 [Amaranthus tricolor]|uniref:uncharacterized protein LOC130803819 n=1 Tax=Amaranthus tricolor TaxID=29722 RepID=UPI00258E3BFF|nr:uncharacterized protein LOC130803819 [Amaranthus tricolor]
MVASFLEKSHNLILNFHSMFSSVHMVECTRRFKYRPVTELRVGSPPPSSPSSQKTPPSSFLQLKLSRLILFLLSWILPSSAPPLSSFKFRPGPGLLFFFILKLSSLLRGTAENSNLIYLCPTECIPQKIEVDISNLDIGDRIFMKDIEVDPSLKLLSGNDTKPICKIVASEVENQFAGR